tara:strand:- start:71 stop:514 length:444 start_codon:yes stop_codon:yes gene_type:complete
MSSRIISGDNNIETEGGNVISYIGSWKEHFISWTKNNDNLLLIKYEDLLENIYKETDKIINFLKNHLNFEISNKKKENIIRSTSFASLQKLEDEGNFSENVYIKGTDKKTKFFNKGPENIWKNSLDVKIQLELEKEFNKELVELGYI